jgi:hypothetical protein
VSGSVPQFGGYRPRSRSNVASRLRFGCGIAVSGLARASDADDRADLIWGGTMATGMCLGEMGLHFRNERILIVGTKLEPTALACRADHHHGSYLGTFD